MIFIGVDLLRLLLLHATDEYLRPILSVQETDEMQSIMEILCEVRSKRARRGSDIVDNSSNNSSTAMFSSLNSVSVVCISSSWRTIWRISSGRMLVSSFQSPSGWFSSAFRCCASVPFESSRNWGHSQPQPT
ncbi:unnamed protein product [Bursaphelenchus xylophilus]|uniref:(pine wood nematode) hypothetical protein n=1 Tax=Bursaphelenchus xylophilus TaxID=6326 RepID=A0A1I7SNZ6_BURXY|nr:unnamed protein product [Bursaphelenchus xylophilus]CAG9131158.1 unnamed protein product [Bursaphelenchus xylophilus]